MKTLSITVLAIAIFLLLINLLPPANTPLTRDIVISPANPTVEENAAPAPADAVAVTAAPVLEAVESSVSLPVVTAPERAAVAQVAAAPVVAAKVAEPVVEAVAEAIDSETIIEAAAPAVAAAVAQVAAEPAAPAVAAVAAPAAVEPAAPAAVAINGVPAVQDFAASIVNGQAGQVVGVHVEGVLALPVVQQPNGQLSYVSEQNGVVTEFAAASANGTVGLLAHNFLSGSKFFQLSENQVVTIIRGDGSQEAFRISKIQSFQALSPSSVYSDFIDVNDPNQTVISAGNLFSQIYGGSDRVVLQTCIDANGNPSWGRLFVTAERIQ